MNDYKWYLLSMMTSTIGACQLMPTAIDTEQLFELIASNRLAIQKIFPQVEIDDEIKIMIQKEQEALDLVYENLKIEPILDGLVTWN
ncbi:TPA: hypothetical protein ACGUON_000724 [Vibrio vulnificus]|nr:hypothetical protein [Vibrio vulnificus]